MLALKGLGMGRIRGGAGCGAWVDSQRNTTEHTDCATKVGTLPDCLPSRKMAVNSYAVQCRRTRLSTKQGSIRGTTLS